MAVSAAKQKANRAYNERTYDRLYVFVEKRQKERLRAYVKQLGVSMNEYITSLIEEDMRKYYKEAPERLAERLYRYEFEIYKSNISHYLNSVGDVEFLSSVISDDTVRYYWDKKLYKEALYMLAAVDYLSRLNEIPLVSNYEQLRRESFDEPLYPRDVILRSRLLKSDKPKKEAVTKAIPEFLRHNIVEGDLRDAV